MYFYICVAAVVAAILGVSLCIAAFLRESMLILRISACALCLFFIAGTLLLGLDGNLAGINVLELIETCGVLFELIGIISLPVFSFLAFGGHGIEFVQDMTALVLWSGCISAVGLVMYLSCSGLF